MGLSQSVNRGLAATKKVRQFGDRQELLTRDRSYGHLSL